MNPTYFETTTKGVVPAAVTRTGTIATTGKVVTGTGTKFTDFKEVRVGDFLYSNLRSEIRVITAIYDDLRMDIDRAFSTNLPAGEPVAIVRKGLSEISFSNTHASTTAKISTIDYDNQNFVAGQNITLSGKTPVAYDPNGGKLAVSNQ
jgi:hypothetical protein